MISGIFLGLGSNLGDRMKNLRSAEELLELRILKNSSVYETEPVGFLEQPWFLNEVIEIETDLSPVELLLRCQKVEGLLNRKREIAKGPRTIDVDILFYRDWICNEPDLVIPHPAVQERKFVLVPFNEIASDFTHPVLKKTISELLASCPDQSAVTKR